MAADPKLEPIALKSLVELGFSGSEEPTREWVQPMLDQLPPVAARNAREVRPDLVSYLAEGFGFSAFAPEDGVVYQTYSTTGRGFEFLMSSSPES